MSRGRNYTDEERAHALAILAGNRGNRARTSRELGIDRVTLKGWAGEIIPGPPGNRRPAQVPPEVLTHAMDEVADNLERAAKAGSRRLAEAVETVPIETAADLRNTAVAVAVNIDKVQLLRGGPTQRVANLHAFLSLALKETTET
ncbi:MAG: hypothetical protein KGI98_15600 [Euryarchaeota archaeon]|nr:hypothetical protein [Euryarchaeota archaeon]